MGLQGGGRFRGVSGGVRVSGVFLEDSGSLRSDPWSSSEIQMISAALWILRGFRGSRGELRVFQKIPAGFRGSQGCSRVFQERS